MNEYKSYVTELMQKYDKGFTMYLQLMHWRFEVKVFLCIVICLISVLMYIILKQVLELKGPIPSFLLFF